MSPRCASSTSFFQIAKLPIFQVRTSDSGSPLEETPFGSSWLSKDFSSSNPLLRCKFGSKESFLQKALLSGRFKDRAFGYLLPARPIGGKVSARRLRAHPGPKESSPLPSWPFAVDFLTKKRVISKKRSESVFWRPRTLAGHAPCGNGQQNPTPWWRRVFGSRSRVAIIFRSP